MQIKINNDLWRIKLIDRDKKKMNPGKGHIYMGLCEYEKLIINIRKGMADSVTRSTIIHELVHAFLFSYGNSVDGEEQMCDFFGAHGEEIARFADRIMKEVMSNADKGRNSATNQ